jgi:hypothetical protein
MPLTLDELFPSESETTNSQNSSNLIGSYGSLRTSDIDSYSSVAPDQNLSKIDENGKLQLRHHKLARLAALGCFNQNQIAERVGMTPSRVSVLLSTPAIQALVEEYRAEVTSEEIADYQRLVSVRDEAVKKLEAEIMENKIHGKDLVSAVNSLLDRTGLPAAKEVKVDTRNTNIDFSAIAQQHFSQQATKLEQTTIDVTPTEDTTPVLLEETLDALFEEKKD